ncbi:uncharacterized protein LOC120172974 [Hibiscus syriacus]|uniref:uncharacterized protein LOC120172974 n=1 Tax=Hibiscus syriacus TaxID=106335 RepID=UPI001920DDCA|nr:uncharacterized protein LOC120172974 [Hibiscus syriacus]
MRDLIDCHPDRRKKIDFFALGIYGLVIFPRVLGHIDVSVVDLFERLDRHVDPVPAILAETFRSLSSCRREGEGRFIGCAPLLLTWILSHFKHVERAPGRVFLNGYAPLLVSRQFGSRKFIPATRELSKSEFAFRGELYKNKVKGVTDTWRHNYRVNLFTFESRLSRGYEEWRSNRVNDNIPIGNQENIQSMEEHLRVIPSPLEQARLDFEVERKQWRVTLQKLKDEVYQKGLEIDIQKSRADRIEKVEKQLRLDFNDLYLSHQRMIKDQASASSSKSSAEWRQEVAGLKREVGESSEELKRSRHHAKLLLRDKNTLEVEKVVHMLKWKD